MRAGQKSCAFAPFLPSKPSNLCRHFGSSSGRLFFIYLILLDPFIELHHLEERARFSQIIAPSYLRSSINR